MARLPYPGSDSGQWGTILNEYLSQTLTTDGVLKDGIVSGANLAAGTGVDNHVLTYDSSLPSKISWKATSGGSVVTGVTTVNTRSGDVTLAKSDVGLDQVNNTSDVAKPISSATQTALDGKAPTVHTHTIANITNLQAALDGKLDDAQLGANNGVASLDGAGKLTSSQLPAISGASLTDATITPAKLDSDAPANGEILSYNSTTSRFEWVSAPTTNPINNQYAAAQTADYWISGRARVDDQTQLGGKTNQTQLVIVANASQVANAPLVRFNTSAGSEISRLSALDSNNSFGYQASQSNTSGYFNVAVGYRALRDTTTGNLMTAIGADALINNTTGTFNTALGAQSLSNTTSGSYNVGIGVNAMAGLATGSRNVGIGVGAHAANIIGEDNTAIGHGAAENVLSNWNTSVGAESLSRTISAVGTTAVGFKAGNADFGTNGSDGMFVSTDSIYSTAIGAFAQVQTDRAVVLGSVDVPIKTGIGTTVPLNTLSVSPLNYAVGTAQIDSAGTAVIGVGTSWTADMVGMQFIFANGQSSTIATYTDATHITLAASQPITPSQSYRIHNPGLQVQSDGRVAIGKITPASTYALDINGPINATSVLVNGVDISGGGTIANQYAAAQTAEYWISGRARVEDQTVLGGKTDQIQLVVRAHATQTPNVPLFVLQNSDGSERLRITAANDGSTAIGSSALADLTSGNWNTAIGSGTLRALTTGASNTGVGFNSMLGATTAAGNTAVGMNSLVDNQLGDYNTAFGFGAAFKTKNTDNTAVGAGALYNNINGGENTAVGRDALTNTLGGRNVAVGKEAAKALTTGQRNTAIGTWALGITTGDFNTALGVSAGNTDYGTDSYNGAFKTLPGLSHTTTIGAYAQAQISNAVVVGSVDVPIKTGIGTTVPLNTLSVSPLNYAVGTAQIDSAGTAVIGVGTSWTADMVGMQFIFANGQSSTIATYTDATHITLAASQPITPSQSYRIHNPGLQVQSDGRVAIGKVGPAAGVHLDVGGAVNASSYLYSGQPEWTSVPATAASSGVTGQKAVDASYLYFCTAPNTWARVARNAW